MCFLFTHTPLFHNTHTSKTHTKQTQRRQLWTKSSLAVARLDGGGLTLEYRPPPWVPAVVARALPPPVRLTHEVRRRLCFALLFSRLGQEGK
jgi:hypothetical protein